MILNLEKPKHKPVNEHQQAKETDGLIQYSTVTQKNPVKTQMKLKSN